MLSVCKLDCNSTPRGIENTELNAHPPNVHNRNSTLSRVSYQIIFSVRGYPYKTVAVRIGNLWCFRTDKGGGGVEPVNKEGVNFS